MAFPGGTTYLVHEICDNNDKVIGYEIIPLKVVESSADDQLSYNLNGAPGSIDPTAGKTGSEVIVTSEVPDWEGHEFLGWSTSEDSAFADYTAGDHYTLTAGDDILFAIWKAKTPQYTIEKSVANEGSGEGGTFKTGETINYKITVTNTGGVAYLDPIILGDSLVDLGGPASPLRATSAAQRTSPTQRSKACSSARPSPYPTPIPSRPPTTTSPTR